MEEALRRHLLATPALAALVGSRIDWGLRASIELPAVRLFEISGVPEMHMAGATGWTRTRVQIETWGRTYKDARDVADLIGAPNGVLCGLRTTVGGIRLRTFIIGRRSDDDTDAIGVLHRTSLDVMVWHGAA